jgi:DNA-binding transcriptional ArsR family regulator
MKSDKAIRALRALAQASRLAAYRLLVQVGSDGLAVGEISRRLKVPAPTLTSHLNVLRRAGLVSDEREGRVIRCRADYAQMNALLGFLSENCCAGDPGACAAAGTCANASRETKSRSSKP